MKFASCCDNCVTFEDRLKNEIEIHNNIDYSSLEG
jgi:hypothetical protein